jgi:group I intron endonuclease
MIIYQINNKFNNKPYIGYSTKFNSKEEFQNSKYWGSGTVIKQAIEKYGIENFERKVLLKNIQDKKELKRYEILWIKKRNTKYPNGYNLTDGGDGLLNPSQETIIKLKNQNMGRRPSDESRIKMRKSHLGIILSERTKRKMRDSHLNPSKEIREKISKNNAKYWKGKKLSKETIEKLSQSKKGKYSKENACRKRKILLISPNGEEFKLFGECHQFCKDNKLQPGNMYEVLKKKRKHHKGWTGKYLD